jgi:N-methylhydantoinase A
MWVNEGELDVEKEVKKTIADFTMKAKSELAEQDIDFASATVRPSLDMRYVGQSYEINVGFTIVAEAQRKFHERHNQRYGYAIPSEDLELVTIRLRVLVPRKKPEHPEASVEAAGEPVEERTVLFEGGHECVPVFRRMDLPAYFEHEGAALIEGTDSTTVVPRDLRFAVDKYGNIIIGE